MFGRKNDDDVVDNGALEFYTVYDSKARTYNEPFPAKNKEVVLRDFSNAFRKKEAAEVNRYYINAEDFAIFKCGKFDVQKGTLTGQGLEHVINLHDLRAISQQSTSVKTPSAQEMGIVPT